MIEKSSQMFKCFCLPMGRLILIVLTLTHHDKFYRIHIWFTPLLN